MIEELLRGLEATLPGGIDPLRVEELYLDSVAEGDDPNHLAVEGIRDTVTFDRTKLESHRDEVAAMLSWLPNEFVDAEQGGGGGWSFLNACQDRMGRQWTGLHLHMEQLFLMGIGLEMVRWMLPQRYWSAFPGGVPYVLVRLPEKKDGA